jgi:MerR family transcriptional regulator, light-induced transcriptional regulator
MRYTVRAAAIATGVAEGRLRTWERRYGIPKPARSDTGRRLYDDDDLALIRRMLALTDAGVSAAEAAEAVLAEAAAGVIPAEGMPHALEASLPSPHPLVFELVDGALHLAESEVEAAISRAVATYGWPDAFDEVLFPALRHAGDEWERGDLLPVHEHFLSELIRRDAMAEIAAIPAAVLESDPGPILLACPPGERHDLGLMGLWLALRQRGFVVVYFGADVPRDALLEAIEQTRPSAVVLSAQMSVSRAEVGLVARAITVLRQAPRVFLGGNAIEGAGAVELLGVRLPSTLSASAELLARELR